jgi:hypothetical protein
MSAFLVVTLITGLFSIGTMAAGVSGFAEGDVYYKNPADDADTDGDEYLDEDNASAGTVDVWNEGDELASKTATEIDDGKTTVTITAPYNSAPEYIDIVYVLDITQSMTQNNADISSFINTIINDVVLKKKDVRVRIGAVGYAAFANSTYLGAEGKYTESSRELLPLTELTASNATSLAGNINSAVTIASLSYARVKLLGKNQVVGSNAESAISRARAILNADSTIPGNQKYLVFQSDGGNFSWGDHLTDPLLPFYMTSSSPYTTGSITPISNDDGHMAGRQYKFGVYTPNAATAPTLTFDPTDLAGAFKDFYDTYGAEIEAYDEYCKTYGADTTILATYPNAKVGGTYMQFYSDNKSTPTAFASRWATLGPNAASGSDYKDASKVPFVGIEMGSYFAAKQLNAIKTAGEANIIVSGLETYVKSDFESGTKNNYAELYYVSRAFLQYAGTLGQYETNLKDANDDIIYDIKTRYVDHGTIEDIVGDEFDLDLTNTRTLPDAIRIELEDHDTPTNSQTLTGTVDSGNPNLLNFGSIITDTSNPNVGKYEYTVEYTPHTGVSSTGQNLGTERIKLTFNTASTDTARIKLVYDLVLTKKTSPSGWHNDVPLNEGATLKYYDGNDEEQTVEYPKPLTRYPMFEVRYNFLKVVDAVDSGGTPTGETVLRKADVNYDYPYAPSYETERGNNYTIIPTGANGSSGKPSPSIPNPVSGSNTPENPDANSFSGVDYLDVHNADQSDKEVFEFVKWIFYERDVNGNFVLDENGHNKPIDFTWFEDDAFDFLTSEYLTTGKTWAEIYPNGLDLIAVYTHNPYTVTFDPNGGTYTSDMNPSADGSVARVVYSPGEDDQDDDNPFWYTLGNYDNKSATGSDIWPVINESNLKRKGYTLIKDGQEALWTLYPSYTSGSRPTTTAINKATEIGHNWYVYAQWEPKDYQVLYVDYDNTPFDGTNHFAGQSPDLTQSNQVWDESKVTLESQPYDRPGYVFKGWKKIAIGSTTSGGSIGTEYSANYYGGYYYEIADDLDNEPSVTYQAIWEPKKYTVYFEDYDNRGFDGINQFEGKTVADLTHYDLFWESSVVITAEQPYERPGYKFLGWKKTLIGNVTSGHGIGTDFAAGINAGFYYVLADDLYDELSITFTAMWEKIDDDDGPTGADDPDIHGNNDQDTDPETGTDKNSDKSDPLTGDAGFNLWLVLFLSSLLFGAGVFKTHSLNKIRAAKRMRALKRGMSKRR